MRYDGLLREIRLLLEDLERIPDDRDKQKIRLELRARGFYVGKAKEYLKKKVG